MDFWHDFRRLGLKPTTIFDVGANIGQWATECRKALPGSIIHSFEPEPKAFSSLSQKFALDSRHFAHQVALSDKVGSAKLRVSHQRPTMHSLEASFHNKADDSVEVATKTVDSVFAELEIDCLSLLKVDIEGHEMACFSGATETFEARKIDAIFVELGFANGTHTPFCKIESFLQAYHFHFLALYDVIPRENKAQVFYCNALFVREGISLK